jgi:phage-related minor tail protein
MVAIYFSGSTNSSTVGWNTGASGIRSIHASSLRSNLARGNTAGLVHCLASDVEAATAAADGGLRALGDPEDFMYLLLRVVIFFKNMRKISMSGIVDGICVGN